jgi:hypothetical protein
MSTRISLDRMMKVAATLAVVGLCREMYVHFVVEAPTDLFRKHPAFDAEYRLLRTLLPASGEIGYVTDVPILTRPGSEWQGPKQRFLQTQYALAPLVLRYDDDRASFVLVNVSDAAHLDEMLRRHSLELIARVSPGVLLTRPRPR